MPPEMVDSHVPPAPYEVDVLYEDALKIEDRFWDRVEKSDDCWEWQAYVNPNGYGIAQFRVEKKKV